MRFRQTVGSMNAAIVIIASGLGLALFAVLALPAPASADAAAAQAENVQINVPDTLVRFSGKTSPRAYVTIKENDTVIGTTVADSNGDYNKLIGAQQRGIHSYALYAWDTRGVVGDTATVTANLTPYVTTDVSAFLPPTIRLSGTALQLGQNLNLSGQTAPGYGGKVVLYLDGVRKFEAIVDGFGIWNFQIETGRFRRGLHSISAVAYQTNGSQSYPGATHYFTVGVPGGGIPNPTPTLPPIFSNPGNSRPTTPYPRSVAPPVSVTPGSSVPVAKVPQVPKLTLPLDGSTAEMADIPVAGDADPDSQIEVWSEGRLVASVFANGKGGWLVPFKLQLGANTITARSCLDKVCSGFSKPVTVNLLDTESFSGLWLMLNESRFSISAGSTVDLGVLATGGSLPFEYEVYWGDGRHDKVSAGDAQTVLSGRYDRAGDYSGLVTVTDAKNDTTSAYFSVRVAPLPTAGQSPAVEWSVLVLSAGMLAFSLYRPRLVLHLIRSAWAAVKLK